MIKFILMILLVSFVGVSLYFGYLARFPQYVSNTSVSGIQYQPQTWNGTITIKGDTYFVPWVALTITPGTKILFEHNPDIPDTEWTIFADANIKDHNDPTGRVGYAKSHFELAGKITAIGTNESPIIFTSANVKPDYADWDQILAFGGSRFEFIELSYAHNGITVTNAANLFSKGTVRVTNSKIHDSLWSCVDILGQPAIILDNEIYHCWHQAIGVKGENNVIIENNYIHDSNLSVDCEQGAEPRIRNNKIEVAPLHLLCPKVVGSQEIRRKADTDGGYYNGRLVYPAISP